MFNKIKVMAMVFVVLIAFTGCIRSNDSIVGEWYSEKDNIRMIINEDGTFFINDDSLEHSELLAGKYRLEGDQFFFTPIDESELVNTYSLKGDTLTLTYKEYSSVFKRVTK